MLRARGITGLNLAFFSNSFVLRFPYTHLRGMAGGVCVCSEAGEVIYFLIRMLGARGPGC